jgi:hypothetical protein
MGHGRAYHIGVGELVKRITKCGYPDSKSVLKYLALRLNDGCLSPHVVMKVFD